MGEVSILKQKLFIGVFQFLISQDPNQGVSRIASILQETEKFNSWSSKVVDSSVSYAEEYGLHFLVESVRGCFWLLKFTHLLLELDRHIGSLCNCYVTSTSSFSAVFEIFLLPSHPLPSE